MKYESLINSIVNHIGGEKNVKSVMHCATRLRFVLLDEKEFDVDTLKEIPEVVTALFSSGQCHVVIGNHVGEVYDELLNMYPSFRSEKEESKKIVKKDKNIFSQLLDTIISIMLPLVNIMAATGIIKGFVILFNSVGWLSSDSGAYNILYSISNVFFYFLPLFVGYSAAKRFKLEEVMGIAVGAIYFYPTLVSLLQNKDAIKTLFTGTMIQTNIATDFFGIPVIFMDYSTTIIPTILSVYFTAKIYHLFKGKLPVLLESFGTPLITLLISLPFSLIIIGPIANTVSTLLANVIISLYSLNPTLISFALGALWIPMVSVGLHSAVVPLAITNFFINGYDVIFPMITGHSFAIAGAMFAIALKQKSAAQKSLAISAGFSAWVPGVIEPALYGFVLENKKLFFMLSFLSGVGGALAGFYRVKLVQLCPGGIFAIPGYIEQTSNGLPLGLVVTLVVIFGSTLVAFILTLFMYKKEGGIE